MPTFTDAWTASQWLYSTLSVSAVTTLATGGVHVGIVPTTVDPPYVVARMPTGSDDLMVVGAVRIWSPQLWDVIAVSEVWETADKIAAAVDLLLHKGSGAPSSGIVHECTRERQISFDEEDEGVQYVYVGGTYLIKAMAV